MVGGVGACLYDGVGFVVLMTLWLGVACAPWKKHRACQGVCLGLVDNALELARCCEKMIVKVKFWYTASDEQVQAMAKIHQR